MHDTKSVGHRDTDNGFDFPKMIPSSPKLFSKSGYIKGGGRKDELCGSKKNRQLSIARVSFDLFWHFWPFFSFLGLGVFFGVFRWCGRLDLTLLGSLS